MKVIVLAVSGLFAVLALGCSNGTVAPTTSPTQTNATQPPTPRPIQEWQLQSISVDQDTVVVSLHVFAGIAVRVTLDGNRPSRVEESIPTLGFVFENVAPGEHPIEIKDVVGHSETASVTVEAPPPVDGESPVWLGDWIVDLDAGKVEFPPISIMRYEWSGETVYYVVKQCCDQFSDLLDADGELIGHPDGGITGRGDGVTSFYPNSLKGEEIWKLKQ